MRLIVPAAAALLVAGCMPPAPPPAAPPPEVAPQSVDLSLARIPPEVVARYTGQWRSGADRLTLSRVGDALIATRPGLAPDTLKLVGLGTFAGGDGTAYLFVPPDGAGGRLVTFSAAGQRRDWTR